MSDENLGSNDKSDKPERTRSALGRTYDRDPEEVFDEKLLAGLRRDREERESAGDSDADAAESLRRRLLDYPNVDENNVDQLVAVYEDRERAKQGLLQRGMSNAAAEIHLDRQGYPRPPGWRSVFFYPGGLRPRNGLVVATFLIIVVAISYNMAV